VFPSVAEATSAFVSYEPVEHSPDPEVKARYDEAYRLYRDVYAALRPVFAGG
jgi:hypothetical protein